MECTIEERLWLDFPTICPGLAEGPTQSCLAFGVECGPGWHQLIYNCIRDISLYNKKSGMDITVVQIKEKWGGLSLYTDYYTESIEEIVDKYEEIASHTCEECGAPGAHRTVRGWHHTLCGEHYRKLTSPRKKTSWKIGRAR